MSYLQTYLEKIEAEAAEKSRIACANAALIELAAEVTARINASAELDVIFPSHHLIDPAETEKYDIHSRVTLMKKGDVSNDELIDALELAGFPVCTLPARVERNILTGKREVFLLIATGVDLRIEPPLPRNAAGSPAANATETHEEALPCAA